MDRDALYMLVSEAILRAEALEDLGAPGAPAAYLDVSLLEEQIAGLLPASTGEGVVARRGAVRAAVSSGDVVRARLLVDRYVADPDASEDLAAELRALLPGEHAAGGVMDGCAPDAALMDKTSSCTAMPSSWPGRTGHTATQACDTG